MSADTTSSTVQAPYCAMCGGYHPSSTAGCPQPYMGGGLSTGLWNEPLLNCVRMNTTASAADVLAASWALHHKVGVHEFRANWKRNGKAAGPMCNHDMLNVFRPDVLIVFPGGVGTAHCASVARALEIPIIEAVVLPTDSARGAANA